MEVCQSLVEAGVSTLDVGHDGFGGGEVAANQELTQDIHPFEKVFELRLLGSGETAVAEKLAYGEFAKERLHLFQAPVARYGVFAEDFLVQFGAGGAFPDRFRFSVPGR